MRILITGARGMLAQAVRARFATAPNGEKNELILTDVAADGEGVRAGRESTQVGNAGARADDGESVRALDITDFEAVEQTIGTERPELIINCAAYTAVDRAETQAELAEKVNALGPENLAKAAGKTGAVLVHISTDYVFGGSKPTDENYVEDDEKMPDSVYGKTKLKGEEEIEKNTEKYYIFRTAWLYGDGPNFVRTMVRLGRERVNAKKVGSGQGEERTNDAQTDGELANAEITVVDDQHGSPTYAEDLAEIIYQAVNKEIPYGVYHATNQGYTTWCEFTREIFRLLGTDCKVVGISSAEYEAQAKVRAAKQGQEYIVAPRPKNSRLSKEKLLKAGIAVPEWKDALERYVKIDREINGD